MARESKQGFISSKVIDADEWGFLWGGNDMGERGTPDNRRGKSLLEEGSSWDRTQSESRSNGTELEQGPSQYTATGEMNYKCGDRGLKMGCGKKRKLLFMFAVKSGWR